MIEYNLQFFAKDGPGGQKTEPASQKKLDDARKKGQIAKSKDLSGSVGMLAAFITLRFSMGYMGKKLQESMVSNYNRIGDMTGDAVEQNELVPYFSNIMSEGFKTILLTILPLLLVGFVVAFVADALQAKWKVTAEPMKPKLSKISPASGIKRIFSIKTIVTLLKSIAIVAVCVIVTYNKLKKEIGFLFNLYDLTIEDTLYYMGTLIFNIGLTIAIIYLVIGVADLIFEKFKFRDEMKMTKQEVKEEWKNTEGSPEVKNKQRRRMQEASRRRMMQAVPEADVVITNPTHFAVALKYEPNSGQAPIVVAKGADYVAQKIKETARDADVEIVENKPLARMLYYNVELNAAIPPELYQAVADVLVYVMKLKGKI